jgi:hypothetical protein
MGNAVQSLKDIATQVVGNNDADGVAQAIEMFVTGSNATAAQSNEITNQTDAPATNDAGNPSEEANS